MRAFTQNGVGVYEAEKDGKFSLFDGNITGENETIISSLEGV